MSEQQNHPSTEPQSPSVWPFVAGCLLLVLVGSGFSAWKFETPIHATLIHSELGLELRGEDWWAGFLTVWGKSLWLALPVLGLVWLLRQTGRVRLSAVLFDLSVALLACWLVLDLYLMTLTRTHVLDYAGGNASYFGLFSLLYGRSALAYEPTLNAGIPPQLCATHRDNDDELSFITSGRCDEWRRMGGCLNDSIFDRLETIDGETWVDRDRATQARVEELLADGDRPPQSVVAFLMSTHFNYEFPPEFALHEPYTRNVSLFTLGEREGLWNRYRNAAAFLDDEVARTIGGLNLDRTVVVVTGDHGESLLDDGQMFHGSRLSEIQTRVPCLLLGADVPMGVVPTMTSHVDLTRR